MAKDLFSQRADLYAQYRPTYPDDLFDYIVSFAKEKNIAWDCATGNGQAAVKLSRYFKQVIATDFSEAQLGKAVPKDNITYQLSPAEQTPFADNTFDLITVATAYHWLNWKAFHEEANRVAKDGSVIAVWTYYTMLTDDEAMNTLFTHFYKDIIYPYWDYERRYVDERYQTVEFNYEPLPTRPFQTVLQWTGKHFRGYLESWSSVQHYERVHGVSPLTLIEKELEQVWPEDDVKTVSFPISLLLGRINHSKP